MAKPTQPTERPHAFAQPIRDPKSTTLSAESNAVGGCGFSWVIFLVGKQPFVGSTVTFPETGLREFGGNRL